MVQKHPSQYFDNVEFFLSMHPDTAPLAMLRSAVKTNGCPEELIDDVVNSAIAQELNRVITPKEHNMTIERNGEVMRPYDDYNPSYCELLENMKSRFVDLEEDRIKGIIDALITKKAISIYDDQKLYRTMALLPRTIIKIKRD